MAPLSIGHARVVCQMIVDAHLQWRNVANAVYPVSWVTDVGVGIVDKLCVVDVVCDLASCVSETECDRHERVVSLKMSWSCHTDER